MPWARPTHFWPRTQNMWLWQQSQPDDRHYGGSFSWGTIHGRKSYVKAGGQSGMTISACARSCTKGVPLRAVAAIRVNRFRSPDQFMHNIMCPQRLCRASPFFHFSLFLWSESGRDAFLYQRRNNWGGYRRVKLFMYDEHGNIFDPGFGVL